MAVAEPAVSFLDATAVRQIDSHTYECELFDDWSIGAVPHGGYVASCFMRVAQLHFSTTLAKQGQPDALTLHLEFPRRTAAGRALFTVKEIKLGGRISSVLITLWQNDKETVILFLNHTNLAKEAGVTFTTDWKMQDLPPPADLDRMLEGTDPNWAEQLNPVRPRFRKAFNRTRFFFPREGQILRAVADQWVTLRNGERWMDWSLGYLCDTVPQLVENYQMEDDKNYNPKVRTLTMKEQKYWFPTVVMNIDVKKKIPEEGIDWLFIRSQAKHIQDGRHDLEVMIFDELGDLVALSHHVVLVVSSSRNLSGRPRPSRVVKL